MFSKILVANRGEIAVRIIRGCKRMGVRTVAVYSDADSRSLPVTLADEAYPLGSDQLSESYLKKEKIIEAALTTGCEAVHPGYGFLSENPAFARMTVKAGLTFIGPPADVIAALGDKIAAKKLAADLNIPIVAGHPAPVLTDEEAMAVIEKIGYPALLKPAAGGGGKGMRVVKEPAELASALKLCRQETRKAFGDDSIFIERYIEAPRHIEIQVLADHHGRVIHLGERECSIQRRYQKIIEESPSTAVDEELRQKMGVMACNLALRAGYCNAGTVEFILDRDRNFYFLEMNTRLQVEHPVTEMVTGIDLIEWQLRIASGEKLTLHQADIRLNGWAIEARICAEDPARGFIPSMGLITRYAEPLGDNIRVDSGVNAGSRVHVFYDSMLAKLICRGENRENARKTMAQALNGYHIEGVSSNVDFANQVINHPAFIRGDLTTDFIAAHLLREGAKNPPPDEHLHFMVITTTLVYHLRVALVRHSLLPLKSQVGGAMIPEKYHDYVTKSENDIFHIRLRQMPSALEWEFQLGGRTYHVKTPPLEFYRRRLKLIINNEPNMFRLRYDGNFIEAAFCGIIRTFEIYEPREWELAHHMPPPALRSRENVLESPMPGLVVEINVKPGDRVYRGQELVIIESMKMESAVASPCDGVVASTHIKPGDTVETGMVLIGFK
ncbi:MAG: acetyl/propionyl/methylcrotonyl-CoA carboxylase subunit alpha [Thermodesulfobacteriota bacterium]